MWKGNEENYCWGTCIGVITGAWIWRLRWGSRRCIQGTQETTKGKTHYKTILVITQSHSISISIFFFLLLGSRQEKYTIGRYRYLTRRTATTTRTTLCPVTTEIRSPKPIEWRMDIHGPAYPHTMFYYYILQSFISSPYSFFFFFLLSSFIPPVDCLTLPRVSYFCRHHPHPHPTPCLILCIFFSLIDIYQTPSPCLVYIQHDP